MLGFVTNQAGVMGVALQIMMVVTEVFWPGLGEEHLLFFAISLGLVFGIMDLLHAALATRAGWRSALHVDHDAVVTFPMPVEEAWERCRVNLVSTWRIRGVLEDRTRCTLTGVAGPAWSRYLGMKIEVRFVESSETCRAVVVSGPRTYWLPTLNSGGYSRRLLEDFTDRL